MDRAAFLLKQFYCKTGGEKKLVQSKTTLTKYKEGFRSSAPFFLIRTSNLLIKVRFAFDVSADGA